MSIRNALFFFICIALTASSFAQPYFQRYDSIQVKINGNYVAFPWSGGLNFVQVSNIDLNLDGTKDLFVFDRTGNKIRTFINKGTPGVVDFEYAPQYENNFPKLTDWALLVDYNCDGKEDIFSYSSMGGGFDIYKNTSSVSTGLQFQKVVTQQRSQFSPPSGGRWNLYVSPVDIPVITDIDNDGDIDIVTFSLSSTTIEYHQNQSMERYNSCDSLIFNVRNNCWGYVSEDALSNDYTLRDTCKFNVVDPKIIANDDKTDITATDRSPERHSGGCEIAIDMDGDGDKEFIVGDVSFNTLTMLTNTGTPTNASFTIVDTAFPKNNSNTVPVNLTIFPCPFYVDINNDGIKDLVVSPNASNVSENFNSIVYYKNKGANNAPVFEYQQSNLLQDNMIDVGEGAYPVFFDYDNDGLKDLFIGNYGYYNAVSYEHKIAQFKNIGTATQPKFELITRDYGNYSSLGIYNMVPTFGDMDGDGDMDMIIGGWDGKLQYFTNNGGAGAANFTAAPTQANLKNGAGRVIDVGDFAAPQIVDVDGDGKKDLVIGRRNGKIAYLHHSGNGTEPIPIMDSVSYTWGNINVKGLYDIAGYSYPFVFKQGGVTKLLTGAENGSLLLYDNIDGNTNGTFNRADSTFQNIWEGTQTAPSGADINNDGSLDLIVGNYQGEVIFFKGAATDCFAHYTTSYDSTQNSFTLIVDLATVAKAVSYNWSFGDGNSSSLATPIHTYSVDTVYNVCMKIITATNDSCTYCHKIGKDYLGNIIRSAGFTINVKNETTGITDILPNEKTDFVVYPNPANNSISIRINNEKNSIYKLELYNVMGQLVNYKKIENNYVTINTEELTQGVYICKVSELNTSGEIKTGSLIKRIIIQH